MVRILPFICFYGTLAFVISHSLVIRGQVSASVGHPRRARPARTTEVSIAQVSASVGQLVI